MTEHTSHAATAVSDTLHTAAHGAAGGHGETFGDIVMHHLTEISSMELFFKKFSLETLQLQLFGIDLSITKPVLFMWFGGLLLLLSFTLAFKGGRLLKNKFAHLLEVYVIFIRDEVVYPTLGATEGRKLLPFFLSVFFFILTCNMLGLVPWGHTATGNVNVTAGLAIVAFIVIQGMGVVKNGFFGHVKATLLPSGIPWPLYIIMVPIEFIGMLAKPFALCIRLFANMVAGHAVILVLLMLIIKSGSYLIAPMPILGVLFISSLEVFVAHLQAFIFTILTVLFTSMTMHPSH